VTIQAQVLSLLEQLSADHSSSVLLISHDLGVVAGFCERLIVMYAGRIVESGPTEQLIAKPEHPYTRALLASVPAIRGALPDRLPSIPGSPPIGGAAVVGCPFAPRCPIARDVCRATEPELTAHDDPGHRSACHATADPQWWGSQLKAAAPTREMVS
jgi:oligopeptide/dipeptide ABC transporter ATP-binding protein